MDHIDKVPTMDTLDKVPKGKAANEESESVRGLIASLQQDIDNLKNNKPINGKTSRRTKEHTVQLREFAVDDKPVGIVLKVSTPRIVKDETEVRRERGLINLTLVDPKTGKESTIENYDYLHFLEYTPRVKADIVKWNREERIETDIRKGGGGRGHLRARNKDVNTDVFDVNGECDFEVSYVDHSFTLKITEGAFEGCTIEADEEATNR